MSFIEDCRKGIKKLSKEKYKNPSNLSTYVKVSQPQITELLKGNSNLRSDTLGDILDFLGAKIMFHKGTKEIVICKVCAGTGCIRKEKRTHWNEYEYTEEPCKNCNGT